MLCYIGTWISNIHDFIFQVVFNIYIHYIILYEILHLDVCIYCMYEILSISIYKIAIYIKGRSEAVHLEGVSVCKISRLKSNFAD